MGKNEFLTPKAIANRIKAKGLQKLKWYCQMCQKQCRDENGFKCHCMSEGHQRQMQVFGDNPERFIDGFSEEFEKQFMEHLKRTHRSSRVAATVVWNEYIADRHHIHMNSTKWDTLTDFVKYLGRVGQCKVDETPKGWFITFIDREPETVLKENLKNKRERAELADEERHDKVLLEQIERATKSAKQEEPEPEKTEMIKQEGEKVGFSLGTNGNKSRAETTIPNGGSVGRLAKTSVFGVDAEDEKPVQAYNANKARKLVTGKDGSAGVLDQMMRESEQVKEKLNRKDYWLCEGLIVKVMTRTLEKYFKQKGVVQRVIGKYVGEIQMVETKDILKVDQEELETVIPEIGGRVRVVNGAYRGSNARLLSIDTAKYSVKVKIDNGPFDGRTITAEYEDICKLYL